MTTIATDGKTIACDSLATWGDMRITHNRKKIHKIGDMYVGASGNSEFISAYIEYLKTGKNKPTTEDAHTLLFLTKGGVYLQTDTRFNRIKVNSVMAIGSGREYAIGAMMAGASPYEAVKIAIKNDLNSGGKVVVYSL